MCETSQASPKAASQTQVSPRGATQGGQNVTLINPLGPGVGLAELVQKILEFVIRIGAIVVTFMLVYVGYKFVVAQGAPDKIKEAKLNLLWTIVGALILLGAQAIATAIQATVQALSGG